MVEEEKNMRGIDDLGDWWNPMIVKEIRQALRRVNFVVPFLACQALALALIWVEVQKSNPAQVVSFFNPLELIGLFRSGSIWGLIGGCCFLMPLSGMFLMEDEIEDGNGELLQLTRLSAWTIATGKLYAQWGVVLLTVLTMLPYVILRYMLGGVEWWTQLCLVITAIMFSGAMTVGVVCCSVYRSMGKKILLLLAYLISFLLSYSFVYLPIYSWASSIHGGVIEWFMGGACAMVGGILVYCYIQLGLGYAISCLLTGAGGHHGAPRKQALLILLILTPFISGFINMISCGFLGGVGLLVIGLNVYWGNQQKKLNPTMFNRALESIAGKGQVVATSKQPYAVARKYPEPMQDLSRIGNGGEPPEGGGQ